MEQSNPFTTLTGLVSHYSPSGREAGAVDWLLQRMASLGFTEVRRDGAGNAIGVLGDGPREVLLLGHIDTVPGEIPVRVESGNLYGRGSVDAKGPLAAFVDAAAQAGPAEGWRTVVVGAVDEERDSAGARHLVDRRQPDLLVVGEPAGWDRIVLGYKGSQHAVLHAHREMAHTAGPEPTPADQLFQAWAQIRDSADRLNDGKDRVFDQLSLKILKMDSGTDGFESWASLEIGARLPVGLAPKDWEAEQAGICKGLGIHFESSDHPIPAYKADKSTPLVSAFLKAIRGEGGRPRFVVKTGTADLNIVAPAWGCPALVFGPGDSNLDHTPNEHISLEDYSKAVQVLKRAITQLTQTGN